MYDKMQHKNRNGNTVPVLLNHIEIILLYPSDLRLLH